MGFVIRKVPGLPRGIGSDHDAYLASGVPGFFWLQAGKAKYNFGHHTQHDVYERAVPEYQRHTSMVVAIGALRIADLPEMLPRTNLTSTLAKRRMLGVGLDTDLTITEITKDSPAEKAGLKIGDRLLKLNGLQIGDTIMLGQAIQSAAKESKVLVHRDGKEVEFPVAFD
jgi:predicted metalloprotease with PDZ domain